MIERIGGYRRYNCKKCREGNHWVWSWHCVKKLQIGRKYRDEDERGSIEDSSYNYNGKLRKKDKPETKNQLSLHNYKKRYSQLDVSEQLEIDEDYDGEVEQINNSFRLGPAVPQMGEDVIIGKDRYWKSLSQSLNVDFPKPDCHKCGYGIAFCEPHWMVTTEHYGITTGNSTYYHPWCYK